MGIPAPAGQVTGETGEGGGVQRADPLETAWRIHAVLADWTGKVDGKAAFALSIESAALAGLLAMSGEGRQLDRVHGALGLTALWAGVALVTAGLLLAVAVVSPRTGSHRPAPDAEASFVFFGHLRHWSPERLAEALRSQDPLPVLSRQLITMAEVAWRKHQLVRASLAAAVLGVCLVALAVLLGG
ncbi:Pycsar system effector family protein [Kitasatospora sp. NPDC101801]|uniref:Pycsar system effector family protein n=1 Tax=Kitasatospora sp. NPDC101801 TaxID=3364103 RepID=UPI003803CDAB